MTTPKPARKKRQTRALILWNELADSTARGKTAEAIAGILRRAGFAVYAFNLEDDIDRLLSSVVVAQPELVVNLVSEFYSDTTQLVAVAGYLDLLGIPYTGSEAMCLVACQDRVRTHLVLDDSGIPVPQFEVVRDINAIPDTSHMAFPVIVTQPFDDTYEDEGQDNPVYNRTALERRVLELAREYALPLKIESYIEDRRVHAVVIGGTVLEVLPVVEWSYGEYDEEEEEEETPGEILDASTEDEDADADAEAAEAAEVEAEAEGRAETADPHAAAVVPEGYMVAQLTPDLLGRIRDLATRAFRAAGCRDYAQVDLHLDENDKPFVVDVRATFDMGPNSVFHFACEQTDRGYDQIVRDLVFEACRRAQAFAVTELKQPRPDAPKPAAPTAPAADAPPAGESGAAVTPPPDDNGSSAVATNTVT